MAQPDADALIEAKHLTIGYRRPEGGLTVVVDGVSFQFMPGQSVGIVGESGSGKSTLARALLGYRRANSHFLGGSLIFDKLDLTRASAPELARIRGTEVAMVPQNPLSSLTFHIPVGAQIEEVLRARAGLDRRAARDRALVLMRETGLPDPETLRRRYPHQLSGGQRQRIVIAAALACDPRLLILDEPTTALDKATETQVLALVRSIQRKRRAGLVLVTHDLNVVAEVCDRVLVMKDGRILEDGAASQVFRRPRTAYAKSLLDAALTLDRPPAARAIGGGDALLSVDRLGFSYPISALKRWRGAVAPKILQDISLQLSRGEVLGVVGESGSGKTTLGALIAGLMGPSAGSIQFEGSPLAATAAKRPADLRRRIQLIFQDPLSSLNPRHTVANAVTRPMRHYFGLGSAPARAKATALFQELGLDPALLDRFPRQLSGGQQQRVAIARAFAAEPDLLICDEITSALDATVQAQMLDQLMELQRRRRAALIMITHDLSVIWRMAPRVIVLRAGQIVEAGDTTAVFAAPKTAYAAELVAAATRAGASGKVDASLQLAE